MRIAAPTPGAQASDQINLTDEESRIMPVSGGGFEQCYNAQAAVDAATMLVTMTAVTQATNDKQQLVPALEALARIFHAHSQQPAQWGTAGQM